MQVRRGDGSVTAVEAAGEPGGRPILFCHRLAGSRLSARLFAPAADELGLRLAAPDRPGTGATDPRGLRQLADWTQDAALVLDEPAAGPVALPGIAAGGPFAAACAARLPGRVRSRTLIAPLGAPGWPTRGMAPGQRLALHAARRAPASGGWFPGRLAVPARRSPWLFARLATSELPGTDRRALAQPGMREASPAGYTQAFRRGSRGVAQDLRVLMRPRGFELGSITVPASIHHGDAGTTVPPRHARLFAAAIPGGRLQLHPGHGHFSILGAARQAPTGPGGPPPRAPPPMPGSIGRKVPTPPRPHTPS